MGVATGFCDTNCPKSTVRQYVKLGELGKLDI
jgi:hypothetical protein